MRSATRDQPSQLMPLTDTDIRAFYSSDDLDSWSPAEDLSLEYAHHPPALIAVMGVTGSGKTTFVNQVSGSYLQVGSGLESCTSEIQVSKEFVLEGRPVILIDTPGFNDTNRSDTDVLKSIAAFLAHTYAAGVTLAGIVYVHRISDARFGGLAAKNFQMFRELCGEKTLANVIFMTNMWGRVTEQQGAAREQQLKDKHFKPAIEKGAQLCRHHNTPESGRAVLRKVLKNRPAVLQIQHELIVEGRSIERTGAGMAVNREIREVVEKHEREIRKLEESMRESMKEKDEESHRELEEERRRMQEEIKRLQKDSAEMQSKFEEARREIEERVTAKVEARMVKLREAYEAEIRKYQARGDERSEREPEAAYSKEKVVELHANLAKHEKHSKCTIM